MITKDPTSFAEEIKRKKANVQKIIKKMNATERKFKQPQIEKEEASKERDSKVSGSNETQEQIRTGQTENKQTASGNGGPNNQTSCQNQLQNTMNTGPNNQMCVCASLRNLMPNMWNIFGPNNNNQMFFNNLMQNMWNIGQNNPMFFRNPVQNIRNTGPNNRMFSRNPMQKRFNNRPDSWKPFHNPENSGEKRKSKERKVINSKEVKEGFQGFKGSNVLKHKGYEM